MKDIVLLNVRRLAEA